MTASQQPDTPRPGPGETQTWITIWDIDDPTKTGNRRYWWDEKQVAGMRKLSPDVPDLSGKPKGSSLASLLRRADGDDIVLELLVLPEGVDTETVRVPLRHFDGSDPERTFVIISRSRAPTEEESKEIVARGFPWSSEVEAIRQEWLAALAAEDTERATELDAALEERGFVKSPGLPWDPDRAIEIQPGVFLQDDRPERHHSWTSP